jgi:hypothetical protein
MTLQVGVLIIYIAVVFLGSGIALSALSRPRFYPVVCLLGVGWGVPAIGLTIIRAARIARLPGAEDAHTQNVILIVSFLFTVGSLIHAWVLVVRDAPAPYERYPKED